MENWFSRSGGREGGRVEVRLRASLSIVVQVRPSLGVWARILPWCVGVLHTSFLLLYESGPELQTSSRSACDHHPSCLRIRQIVGIIRQFFVDMADRDLSGQLHLLARCGTNRSPGVVLLVDCGISSLLMMMMTQVVYVFYEEVISVMVSRSHHFTDIGAGPTAFRSVLGLISSHLCELSSSYNNTCHQSRPASQKVHHAVSNRWSLSGIKCDAPHDICEELPFDLMKAFNCLH